MDSRKIKVSVGRTINLGSYESARIDISVEEPMRPGQSVSATFDSMYDALDEMIAEKEIQIRKNN